MYTVPYRWRFPHAAPEHRAPLPALAHPRAHGRLPARGRMGTADAGRPGRLPPAGAVVGFARRPVASLRLPGSPNPAGDPLEGHVAPRQGRLDPRAKVGGARGLIQGYSY